MAKKDIHLVLEAERTSKEYAEHYHDTEGSMKGLFALDARVLDSMIQNGSVLDAMMGPGRHVVQLARRGIQVHGNDFNRHMVEVARRNLRKERLRAVLTNSDVRKLPIKSGAFDYVICMYNALGSIMGSGNRQMAVAEMARVCKKGGLVILHAHNLFGDLTHFGSLLAMVEATLLRRNSLEFGDLIFHDDYLKDTYQHLFSARELSAMFTAAGLKIEKKIFLRGCAQASVAKAPFKEFLSGGFIFVGRKVS
ncbi:class I SAM-dependent methyltransferase [Candidatus Woesearchaeota archaeon]|nr:class I SAM-dependent methyltransferase [Candidatus Woesearchaeota archaeon]